MLLHKITAMPEDGLILMADTGVGKSTALVGALKAHFPRVWLLVPRIVLRDEYENMFYAESDIARLARGRRDDGQGLVVATYGYMRALMAAGGGIQPGELVVLDEFHEAESDMGIVWMRVRGKFPCLAVSATPKLTYMPKARIVVAPFKRRFAEPTPTRLDLGALDLWLEARREHPEEAKRALIVVPGVETANAIAEELVMMGVEAHALTRARRTVPRSGVIVATQIVDAGLNIRPPALVLVDEGWRVASDQGVLAKRASDPYTDKQRRGRVAREAEGFVYANPRAGTGPDTTPYPTWTGVCGDRAARAFVFEHLGITNRLWDWGALASPVDAHMRLAIEDLHPDGMPLKRDTLVALCAMWLFRCESPSLAAADRTYDRVQLKGWGEHENGVRQMLHKNIGSNYLVPREEITHALALMPFEVRDAGAPRRVDFIRVQKGEVVPL